MKRIRDTDAFTPTEALTGLALRNDRRGLPQVCQGLAETGEHRHLYDAAAKAFLGIDQFTEIAAEELLRRLRGH